MKIVYVITAIVVLGLFGFVAYRYFQQKPTSLSEFKIIPSQTATSSPIPQPEVQPTKPEEVVANQIKDSLAKNYQKPAGEVTAVVTQLTPEYARGTANFTGETTTGWWLALKEKGGWLLVASGKGKVNCQAIKGYGFPASIVPECAN